MIYLFGLHVARFRPASVASSPRFCAVMTGVQGKAPTGWRLSLRSLDAKGALGWLLPVPSCCLFSRHQADWKADKAARHPDSEWEKNLPSENRLYCQTVINPRGVANWLRGFKAAHRLHEFCDVLFSPVVHGPLSRFSRLQADYQAAEERRLSDKDGVSEWGDVLGAIVSAVRLWIWLHQWARRAGAGRVPRCE